MQSPVYKLQLPCRFIILALSPTEDFICLTVYRWTRKVKTRERRLHVAVAGKSDPCLSAQPREEPMDFPQASSSCGEMMDEGVLPRCSRIRYWERKIMRMQYTNLFPTVCLSGLLEAGCSGYGGCRDGGFPPCRIICGIITFTQVAGQRFFNRSLAARENRKLCRLCFSKYL